jgi:hypothetical protein
MAQTAGGKKFNRVLEYTRTRRHGEMITVREHVRSKPSTSKGKTKVKAR